MLDLKNMPIWKRLSLGFGSLGAAMLVIFALGWWGLGEMARARDQILQETHKSSRTHEMIDALSQIYLGTWSLTAEKDPGGREPINAQIQVQRNRYREAFAELKGAAPDAKDRELLTRFEATLAGAKASNDRVAEWANAGKLAQASQEYLVEGGKIKKATDGDLNLYLAHRNEVLKEARDQAERTESWVKAVLLVALVAGAALATFMGVAIARLYIGDVGAVSLHTRLLAEGNFSMNVPGAFLARKDEFGEMGRTYQTMIDNIRNLMRELTAGVHSLASSATELAASAEEMASTTGEIARSTDTQRGDAEHMASAIAELSASIDEVSSSAQTSLRVMEGALEATQRGDEAGGATQVAMEGVTETAERIASAVHVITEIANQTNLLSLNAAIEAAKAGDQGKGFAVVAEEVRKLAERSATSAKEIVRNIEAAREAVGKGVATAGTTAQLLKEIRGSLDQFAAQTRQVSVATTEQSRAGAEAARLVEATVQESTATASAAAQMSASTSEVARTASDLAALGDKLDAMIQRFKL